MAKFKIKYLHKIIIINTFLLFFCINSYPNNKTDFYKLEKKLNNKSLSILQKSNNKERLKTNQNFQNKLIETLNKPGSIKHPFDSLEAVSVLQSNDKLLKIFTWEIPLTNGYYEYFGIIQIKEKKNNSDEFNIKIIELNDISANIESPEKKELCPKNWYGAYYYELIHNKYNGKDYYTLLGWRGNSPIIRQRLIEPLVICSEKGIIFGDKIFDDKFNENYRIIFSFSARVYMQLNYHKVFPFLGHSNFDEEKIMIVFEEIDPIDESLKGHYQFYKPITDVSNGLHFNNGKWVYHHNVDARNPEREIPEPIRLEID